MSEKQMQIRFDAMEDNIEWLRENAEVGDMETAKRVGILAGDAEAIKRHYTGGGE